MRLSRLPPDSDHPYGHGRFEPLGSLAISVLLVSAAAGFGGHAYGQLRAMAATTTATAAAASTTAAAAAAAATVGHSLFSYHPQHGASKQWLALVAAAVSILSKESVSRLCARTNQSTIL